MTSIHLCSFKTIPEILFDLCSGQKCGRRTSAKQYIPTSSKGGGGGIINRENIFSVVIYKKNLRLGKLITVEPWQDNYHFSQLC